MLHDDTACENRLPPSSPPPLPDLIIDRVREARCLTGHQTRAPGPTKGLKEPLFLAHRTRGIRSRESSSVPTPESTPPRGFRSLNFRESLITSGNSWIKRHP